MKDKLEYSMFTDEGNQAVEDSFLVLENNLENTVEGYRMCLFNLIQKHPEFTDTDVRDTVCIDLAEILLYFTKDLAETARIDPTGFLVLLMRRIDTYLSDEIGRCQCAPKT